MSSTGCPVSRTRMRRSSERPRSNRPWPPCSGPDLPYEWQYVATRENEVPPDVLRAASAIKIGIVDTGADVTQPDLAAKSPETWDVVHRRASVPDRAGHGTFVAALAAGSVTNDEGIAGFGGDAQLLMVRAIGPSDDFSDVDEAAAIVYAVDHGAKIVNLSLGGVGASPLEQRAIEYAASHDVLLVAAAGNEYQAGNPIEYPAAALQPPGSNGQGGVGLSVAATTMAGKRASFSNTGSQISLAAPGENVFSAIAAGTSRDDWPRYVLPGSNAGLYGWSSGTSFSTPEVAGAAALVWAANGALTAQQVAAILKSTASGRGRWNPRLGYGVIDVAAAVAAARGQQIAPRARAGAWLSLRRVSSRGVQLDSADQARTAPGAPPRRPPANQRPAHHTRLPDDHAPGAPRRKLASPGARDDAAGRRDSLDVRAATGPLRAARRLPRPLGPPRRDPAQAGPRALSRGRARCGRRAPRSRSSIRS